MEVRWHMANNSPLTWEPVCREDLLGFQSGIPPPSGMRPARMSVQSTCRPRRAISVEPSMPYALPCSTARASGLTQPRHHRIRHPAGPIRFDRNAAEGPAKEPTVPGIHTSVERPAQPTFRWPEWLQRPFRQAHSTVLLNRPKYREISAPGPVRRSSRNSWFRDELRV